MYAQYSANFFKETRAAVVRTNGHFGREGTFKGEITLSVSRVSLNLQQTTITPKVLAEITLLSERDEIS